MAHLNSQALLVGIVKTSFQNRPVLFNSFYTSIDNNTEINSMGIIDLWILFSLSGILKNRSKIHTILAKKYLNKSLTSVTLNAAISGYGIALESVFSSMLTLGKFVIRFLLFCIRYLIHAFCSGFYVSNSCVFP